MYCRCVDGTSIITNVLSCLEFLKKKRRDQMQQLRNEMLNNRQIYGSHSSDYEGYRQRCKVL
jgi:hypothetical protein